MCLGAGGGGGRGIWSFLSGCWAERGGLFLLHLASVGIKLHSHRPIAVIISLRGCRLNLQFQTQAVLGLNKFTKYIDS